MGHPISFASHSQRRRIRDLYWMNAPPDRGRGLGNMRTQRCALGFPESSRRRDSDTSDPRRSPSWSSICGRVRAKGRNRSRVTSQDWEWPRSGLAITRIEVNHLRSSPANDSKIIASALFITWFRWTLAALIARWGVAEPHGGDDGPLSPNNLSSNRRRK